MIYFTFTLYSDIYTLTMKNTMKELYVCVSMCETFTKFNIRIEKKTHILPPECRWGCGIE